MDNVFIEKKKTGETIGLQTIAIHDIGADYIRFTNGVQICWGYKSFTGNEIDLDQMISKASITFPKTFIGSPCVILGRQCGYRINPSINTDASLYLGFIKTDHFIVCGSTAVDASSSAVCMYAAFGKWK